jgi:hypothetical protein
MPGALADAFVGQDGSYDPIPFKQGEVCHASRADAGRMRRAAAGNAGIGSVGRTALFASAGSTGAPAASCRWAPSGAKRRRLQLMGIVQVSPGLERRPTAGMLVGALAARRLKAR